MNLSWTAHCGGLRVLAAVVVLTAAANGWAHASFVEFSSPFGAGNRTDGGRIALQWTDAPDPTNSVSFFLLAHRDALPPFEYPDGGGINISGAPIPMDDPVNVFVWNAEQVAPGCYQPYALVTDFIEKGTSPYPAGGVVTVVGDAGVPPSIWITNQAFDRVSPAGRFRVELALDGPDEPLLVSLRWADSTPAHLAGPLVERMPMRPNAGRAAHEVDVTALPPGAYYLQARVDVADGGACTTWWPHVLYVRPRDGGTLPTLDGGGDAGAVGGGEPLGDAGAPAPPPPPQSCGCTAPTTLPAGLLWLCACAWVRRGRKARR